MRKNKINVAVKNAVGNDAPMEIYFLDLMYDSVIYDWFTGTEWCTNMVQDVIQQVRAAQPSRIKLIIDSEGGDATIGMALYNFFKYYNARIDVEILGMCGSIASVLAQAASKGRLLIPRNGFMVIHQAWGSAVGEADDLRNAADVIDMYTAQIVDIYAQNNRKGKTAQEIAGLIADGDYWMTGEQAVAEGFADDTYNNDAIVQVAARIQTLDERYTRIPDTLKAAISSEPEENASTTPAVETTEAAAETTETATTPAHGNSANKPVKNVAMKFKELVNAAINGIKGKKIDGTASNLAEEVANQIGGPLTELAEAMQLETQNAIDNAVTTVTNNINTSWESRFKPLEEANAALLKENNELKQAAADETGKETTTTTSPKNESSWSGSMKAVK